MSLNVCVIVSARASGEPIDEEEIRRQILEQYEQAKQVRYYSKALQENPSCCKDLFFFIHLVSNLAECVCEVHVLSWQWYTIDRLKVPSDTSSIVTISQTLYGDIEVVLPI